MDIIIEQPRNSRIDLGQIDRKGELGWEDLLESECVQKDGNADGSHVEDKHPPDKPNILIGIGSQKDQMVDVKGNVVLGPHVKELDHHGANRVKHFVLFGTPRPSHTGQRKMGARVPGTDHNVGPKHKDVLQSTRKEVALNIVAQNVVVHGRTNVGKQRKVQILVHKDSRQDSTVRIVAWIYHLGQHTEGKVGRNTLHQTCRFMSS